MPCLFEKGFAPEREVCPALGFQDVIVGVPVEICPFANVGRIKTDCIGKPIISRGSGFCEGKPICKCKFTISQKIRIEVPVLFGAKTEVGEARIECKHQSCPCHEHSEPEFHEKGCCDGIAG